METNEISLTKYLSTSGVCSRRGAESLIAAGRITVNEIKAERGAMRVRPGDRVRLDGRPVAPPAEKL
ncbi:MAG: 23S rRNA pseudouridine synthase F, partial [Lentisphaeria bacterium]|nr:23S rRNA pseudouridine synthase F [Lentisphaeria bacterium]